MRVRANYLKFPFESEHESHSIPENIGKLPIPPERIRWPVARSQLAAGGYAPRTPRRPPGNILSWASVRSRCARVPAARRGQPPVIRSSRSGTSHGGPSKAGPDLSHGSKQLRPSDGGGDRNAKHSHCCTGDRCRAKKNCPAGGGPPVAVRPGITGRRWSIPVPFASVIGRRFGWSPGFGVPAGTPLHRHLIRKAACCFYFSFFLSYSLSCYFPSLCLNKKAAVM